MGINENKTYFRGELIQYKMHLKYVFSILFIFLNISIYAQKIPAVSEFVPQDVSVIEDINYVTYGSKTLKLDLYRPQNHQGKLATIVVIRGGGFRVGNKIGFASLSAALAKEGFATVCIEYRTTSEALFPAAIHDAKSAVKWIHDHATEYNLDASKIGVIGASAGAHLSMTLATTGNVTALNPDAFSENYKVNAAVVLAADADFATATDDKNLIDWLGATYEENRARWELASPITHIDSASAPILFIHGAEDPVVSIDQSTASMSKLIENDVYCELVALSNVGHNFWINKKWFEFTVKRATMFFQEQL
jgi:acetyl esterase/lipase